MSPLLDCPNPIEPQQDTTNPREGVAFCGDADALAEALADPDFARVVTAWPHLAEALRRAVLALIGAAQEGR